MIGVDMVSSLFIPLSIYGSYKRKEGKEEQSKTPERGGKKYCGHSRFSIKPKRQSKIGINSGDSVADSVEIVNHITEYSTQKQLLGDLLILLPLIYSLEDRETAKRSHETDGDDLLKNVLAKPEKLLIHSKKHPRLFFFYLKGIVGREVTVELKNDLAIREIHPQRLMDKMEQPRARDRQRRQPMSSSQRQTYLARRRAIAQGKRPMVETSSSNITKQAAGKVRNRCPQQKKKIQRDEGFRRRVSVFSSGWRMGQSVNSLQTCFQDSKPRPLEF